MDLCESVGDGARRGRSLAVVRRIEDGKENEVKKEREEKKK